MLEYLWAGGPVMIPIGLCSIVAVATFLERSWALRRERVVPSAFVVELADLIKQRRWQDALTLCRKREIAIGRVVEVALEVRAEPRSVVKERVEEVGRREAAEMERARETLRNNEARRVPQQQYVSGAPSLTQHQMTRRHPPSRSPPP